MTVGKYLGIFIDEGRDLIKKVGTRLIRFEEEPGDIGALDSALRMIHTLKGSSKMVGLDNIALAAHAMENRLKASTATTGPLSREEMNIHFSTLDHMEEVLSLAAAGRTEEAKNLKIAQSPAKESPATAAVVPAQPAIIRIKRGISVTEIKRPVEQTKPPPADGLRVGIDRLDRLQGHIEDLIVQKWKILEGLESMHSARTAAIKLAEKRSGQHPGTPPESEFTSVDLAEFSEEIYRMASLVGELQLSVMELRMIPLSDLFAEYQRMVRDLAENLGKEITLSIEGAETEVDRNLLEGLQGPITHLLRNAADHGIEKPAKRTAEGKDPKGSIWLRAYRKPSAIVVEVEDDGCGLDPENIKRAAVRKGFLSRSEAETLTETDCFYLLLRAGFTTRSSADEVSGRGVGLDAVKVRLERLRGSLSIASEKGKYTLFRMFLPQSLSIIRGLIAKSEGIHAAFPTVFVEHCIGSDPASLTAKDGLIEYEGQMLKPVSLKGLFGLTPTPPVQPFHVIIFSFRKRYMALAVDRVEREQELVVKNLDDNVQHASCLLGISLLADGSPAPIIDIPELYERWPGLEISAALPLPETRRSLRVLVVDDAVTSRHVETSILESMGHTVEQSEDGLQAIRLLGKKEFDLVVTDLEMPNVDGIELVRQMRRDEKLKNLPVIMVTSLSDDLSMDKSYEAGVNVFLTKDRLSRQVLGRSIRKLIPE